ncbi:hypothetical protein MIND_01219100 [Mycena indigotica]|uniref:ASX DEUBAD domain-containing protein n=1 Tax=Mycena indigotica TaxID=2126181 RepID=A0A8H6S395_9AGAR|nr:uncharacterized protein MIND_01219100 [Mycena indigotica]KAF7291936.1 hypothetical protein MIND_01219100 [Mycena indigotica]
MADASTSSGPRRSTRKPKPIQQETIPIVEHVPAKRKAKDDASGVDSVERLVYLLQNSKSQLTKMDISDVINANVWDMLSPDAKMRLAALLPATAFRSCPSVLESDHPAASSNTFTNGNSTVDPEQLDLAVFTDSHFLAAAHTFQDHLFSNWLSDSHAEKMKKYIEGTKDGSLAAPWKDEVWERDNGAPTEDAKPIPNGDTRTIAGEAADIKLVDLIKNSVIREGDVLAYKRKFAALGIVVEKDLIIQQIDARTRNLTVLVEPGIIRDLSTSLLLPGTIEPTGSIRSMTISSPSQLENGLLDIDGRVERSKRPHGNAWKSLTPGGCMSLSPPIRRLSVSSATKQEDLINAYEAEEERIINVLSKKLEQLKEEKIELENVLEAESESHVNRLSRELAALRLAQLQSAGTSPQTAAVSADPSLEIMLQTLQRENEALRSRLADTERDFVRISRLNEVYREELVEHRNRLGLPLDHLIGLASADPYSQPTHLHQRPQSAFSSSTSSPTNSVLHFPSGRLNGSRPPAPPTNGVPIPRPIVRARTNNNNVSEANTPLSHSPSSSSDSPFPFSPVTSPHPTSTSYVSVNSNMTSPPASFNPNTITFATPSRGLSYPSVPPPSLSSSFGSPTVSYLPLRDRDPSLSPVEPQSRRNSMRRGARVVESGSLRGSSHSRRGSMERGGRVAETGQLVPRSHIERTLPATTEAPDSPTMGDMELPE